MNTCGSGKVEQVALNHFPPQSLGQHGVGKAVSTFIREKKDFCTVIFDTVVAMAVGSDLPIFGDIVGPVLRRYPLESVQPGDLYWYNDCYGSHGLVSHSSDQVFLVPVFAGEEASGEGGRTPCASASSWAGRISPISAGCARARSAPTPLTTFRRESSFPRPLAARRRDQ